DSGSATRLGIDVGQSGFALDAVDGPAFAASGAGAGAAVVGVLLVIAKLHDVGRAVEGDVLEITAIAAVAGGAIRPAARAGVDIPDAAGAKLVGDFHIRGVAGVAGDPRTRTAAVIAANVNIVRDV